MQHFADTAMQRFVGGVCPPHIRGAHLDQGHRGVGVEDDSTRVAIVGRKIGKPFHIAAEPVVGVLHHDGVDAALLHDAANRGPAPHQFSVGNPGQDPACGIYGVAHGWVSAVAARERSTLLIISSVWPDRKARMFRMIRGIAMCAYSSNRPPICGAMKTWGISHSRLAAGSGSVAKTSRPAPAMRRCSSASIKAASSTVSPRPTLMK